MVFRPILEVFDKDTGYKGGGRRREPGWRKVADWKQLSATLKEMSVAAREDGSWDSGTETGDTQVGK